MGIVQLVEDGVLKASVDTMVGACILSPHHLASFAPSAERLELLATVSVRCVARDSCSFVPAGLADATSDDNINVFSALL